MNKFNGWFKKNVFEILFVEDDCYAMRVFNIFIDFRNWYKETGNNGYFGWWLESEVEEILSNVEKKNKKRKNKLPIPTFTKIPWYKTIINWRSLLPWSRMSICFITGLILGGRFF